MFVSREELGGYRAESSTRVIAATKCNGHTAFGARLLTRSSVEARRLALAAQPASVHAGHMRAVNV